MAKNNIVFTTPWFDVEAMDSLDKGETPGYPYYRIVEKDGVCAVVLTDADEVVLIRQYRPAIEKTILELPAGAVLTGESLLSAINRELIEETGYQCPTWAYMGSTILRPDRCMNISHTFIGVDAKPVAHWSCTPGIERVLLPRADFRTKIKQSEEVLLTGLGILILASIRYDINFFDDTLADIIKKVQAIEVPGGTVFL